MKRLSRKQKIWVSVGATVLGVALLAGIGVMVQAARDTDMGDEREGLTAAFRGGDVDAPPVRLVGMQLPMSHGCGRLRSLPEDTGSGLAWGDVDGDGDFDLYVVNLGGANSLFRNDGPRRLGDVARNAGVDDAEGFGMGASFADYDGDGDLDLYVTNRGPNRLYRNKGDGTFEDVAKEAGVDDPLWSTSVAWGDYDRDGDLDLYVCNYVDYDVEGAGPASQVGTAEGAYAVPFTLNPNAFDPQPNRLYRNNGDGTFEDVAQAAFVANPEGRTFAATFCDLDGDGWLDLYVNNDVSANRLYKNLGGSFEGRDVAFTDIGMSSGTADPRGSMGLSVSEIGFMSSADAADGLPDLFISHWVAQENAFYQSLLNKRGKLEYRDKTRRFRLGEISLDTVGWGCVLADLDLDGRPDLVVANGSTLEQKHDPTKLIAEPIFLFWNTGTHFHDVAPEAGEALAKRYCARGLAAADYDGDGDVDLAINVNQGVPLLLRNDTETENNSLAIRLDAPAARTFGARIEVTVAGKTQLYWWGADVSVFSQHAPEWIVGLGTAAKADRIHVRWADGTETTRTDVAAGRISVSGRPAAR